MGSVTWYDQTYEVGDVTTGAVVELLTVVAARLVSSPSEESILAALEWIVARCSIELGDLVELANKAQAEGVTVLGLAFDVVEAADMARRAKVTQALRIREGVPDGWNPSRGTGCECARCSGLSDDVADCKYVAAGISMVDRMVAGLDIPLAVSLWDRPYSLYTLAREQSHAQALGMEYRRQTPDDSPASLASREARHRAVAQRMRTRYHRGNA